jgi:excisionase family DNA binding protein
MNHNPFDQIDSRLSNIENLLLSISEQKTPEPKPEQPELMTIDEASSFLRLAKPTVYTLCSRGKLPYMKRAKKLYFYRSELLDYLRFGRAKAAYELRTPEQQGMFINKKGGAK